MPCITYFVAIVGPAAKLHVAVLVVEWEPSDIDLAGGLEDARRDVGQHPSVPDHNLDWISAVKSFVGAAKHTQKTTQFQICWPICLATKYSLMRNWHNVLYVGSRFLRELWRGWVSSYLPKFPMMYGGPPAPEQK